MSVGEAKEIFQDRNKRNKVIPAYLCEKEAWRYEYDRIKN